MPIDYLDEAKAALARANRLSTEVDIAAVNRGARRPPVDTRSEGAKIRDRMLSVADLVAIPASFVPATTLPASVYLGARSAAGAAGSLAKGDYAGAGLNALFALPALRGLRAVSKVARAAKADEALRRPVRESVELARSLKDIGYNPATASRIAQTPGAGKTRATTIRHLSQLPDDDRLNESLTALRSIRGGRPLPVRPTPAASSPVAREVADYTVSRNARVRGTPEDVPDNPVAQALERERQVELEAYLSSGDAGGAVGSSPTYTNVGRSNVQRISPQAAIRSGDAMEGLNRVQNRGMQIEGLRQAAGRPPGRVAGFTDLPELSLGELARITENMRRIAGR